MTLNPSELEELVMAAKAWAGEDPDPATAAELGNLLQQLGGGGAAAAAAVRELEDRFSGTLEFGTAGLRAALGAGPRRMNRIVVRRTAAGIAEFLQDTARERYIPSAVIGYDARHNSRAFALETAAVFTAAGVETFVLPYALPTPVLAYAVRALDSDAGVMVTASHNPAADNGYKVYLGGRTVKGPGKGAQIVVPYDAEIAARIRYATPLAEIETAPGGWTVVSDSIVADYINEVNGLAAARPERDLRIVLTSLHGVGGETMTAVLRDAGFRKVIPVAAQAEPDPDFPTVAFPNPEEPGALDLALAAAVEHQADLVLANDPDADRVAVAAKDPADGQWRMLRGDEVGALLGRHLARRIGSGQWKVRGEKTRSGVVFANSIVSSRLLSRVAEHAGFGHVETLTGFKWISRVPHLTYGYEEALGYCVAPGLVRDKDGISAGLLLAELAAQLKAGRRTLFDELDELALLHGLHVTDQLSVRVADLDLIGGMMDRLRSRPPESLGGSAVDAAVDLSVGSGDLPPTDGMKYLTRDNTRVIIRPSGTEPKLKCYLEVIVPVSGAEQLPDARREARTRLDAVLVDIRGALGL